MEYFIIDKNGQQAGPFSLDQLAQKAITPETLVWAQGMADWTPAWKVEELKTVLEAAEAIRDNEATQEEATTGTVPPSYQPEQPQKKSSKTLWKIILGLVVFIILMLAVTNPGADAHKEKVRTEVSKAVEKATETTDNNFFSQAMRSVAKMMAGTVMDEAMDQLFQYHNYIICSKGTVEFDGKEHTVSFGILGKVYTMNADDMVKALETGDNLRIEESSSSSDDSAMDESSSTSVDENANTGDDDASSDLQQKLEDKANKALDKAADKVSKKVEEKINQKLNEATDSSTVEKIIDKILELI